MTQGPSPARPQALDENALLAVLRVLPSPALLVRNGRVVHANPAFSARLGRTDAELAGRSLADLAPGGSAGGRTRHLRHADGREVLLEGTAETVFLDGLASELLVLDDVTDLRRAEQAREESEERFRSVFHSASIGKGVATPDLRFLQVNPAYCAMFGYEEAELLRLSPDDLTHPDDPGENARLVRELLAGPTSSGRVLKLYRHRDGRRIWGDQTLTLIRDERGRPAYFLAEVVDVTERLHAEELLRDREARLAEAQRVAHLGSWEYDIATRRSVWSEEMYRIFQLDPATFDPSRDSAIPRIHPEDVELSGRRVHRTIVDGTPYEYEFRIVLDDGEVRTLWTIGRAELGRGGKPSRIYGIVQDVTERKRADLALRESEARYRALVEHAPEAITVLDVASGKFVDLNDNVETLFGRTRAEILGLGPLDFCPEMQPDGRPSDEVATQYIEQARRGGTPTFEFVCTHASGRDFPCQIRLARLPAHDRELIRSTIIDVSEQKLLQENVRHGERMAAIGVLAAGVAHEIGNPLLALSMAAQSLQRRSTDEYARKKLDLLREHIDRISRIVRQMSDLARPRATRPASHDVNRAVEQALEIVRYDRRAKEVEIRFEPAHDLPAVRCVADQIVQVCLNLGLNALDAVAANPPGRPRRLRVGTARVTRDGRAYVRTSFLDSGPGVPVEVRERVFQPFFSTKAPGSGTGLGLSVSARIVEEHGGRIDLECPAAGGTDFHFDLPLTEHP